MEGWILALVIVLSIIAGLFVIYGLATFIFYLIGNPICMKFAFKVVLFLLLLGLCILFGKIFHDFIAAQIGYFVPQHDLYIWDNIWWVLALIVFMLIIAVIVKSISHHRIKYELIYATIGMIFILLIYTLMYIIYIFREKLWFITLILAAIAVGMIIIILILQYMAIQTMMIFMPFQFIFGLDCVLLIICATWLFITFVIRLYDWFSKK